MALLIFFQFFRTIYTRALEGETGVAAGLQAVAFDLAIVRICSRARSFHSPSSSCKTCNSSTPSAARRELCLEAYRFRLQILS